MKGREGDNEAVRLKAEGCEGNIRVEGQEVERRGLVWELADRS